MADVVRDSIATFAAALPNRASGYVVLPGDYNEIAAALRKLNEHLQGTKFNVMDYGATGDGSTDDTSSIQSAVDAAEAAGGFVFFPNKTFKIASTVTIGASRVVLVGDNARISFTPSAVCFNFSGSAGSEITDVGVVGFVATATVIGTGGQQFVQFSHVRRAYVAQCYMQDFGGVGVKFNANVFDAWAVQNYCKDIGTISLYAEGAGDGAGAGDCKRIHFVENIVEGYTYGIEAKECTDVTIRGNLLFDGDTSGSKPGILITRNKTTGDEITPARISIIGNHVHDSDDDGIDCTQCVDFEIVGNVVTGAASSGIIASGSNFVVSNNIVMDCDGGISTGYNSSVHGGTGGVSSTNYDTAQGTVVNNRVVRAGGQQSYNFNDLDESSAFGNVAHDQVYAGYAFVMTDCDGLQLKDNVARGGSFTYGYRFEDTCSNMTVCNNESSGGSSGHSSQPSSYAGHWIERGYNREIKLGRVQTTDATVTTAASHTIPGTHSLVKVVADVVMKSSSGSSYRGAWTLEAHVYRTTGGATLQGSVAAQFSENNDGGLAATIDVSGNDLRVRVTGIAATNLLWEATLTMVKREI